MEQTAEQPRASVTRGLGWLLRIAVLAGFAYLFLVRMPLDDRFAPIYADAAIYAIVGLSLNILIGYTGQLSLGHNGFFGIGCSRRRTR